LFYNYKKQGIWRSRGLYSKDINNSNWVLLLRLKVK
jgi:hypothetical protein